jgi:hypothetical protein
MAFIKGHMGIIPMEIIISCSFKSENLFYEVFCWSDSKRNFKNDHRTRSLTQCIIIQYAMPQAENALVIVLFP